MGNIRKGIYLLQALTMLLVTASCTRNREMMEQLESVASYVEDAPARALSALDSLHHAGISGREANARYALLYSMALDKNYIDKTDDSLINVAVSCFRRHGSADDRLKAYYYQGRIYHNAGDNESAMESFVKAEQYADDADDLVAAGMLYKALAVVYDNIFDSGTAENYNNKAMACYKKAGDIDKYAGTLIYASDLSYVSGNYEMAGIYLDSTMSVMDALTDKCRILFHGSSMQLKRVTEDWQSLAAELADYVSEFDPSDIFWHDVAHNYIALKEYDSAFWALEQYRKYRPDYKSEPVYYLMSTYLHEAVGDYKAALEDFEVYSDLSDSLSLVIAEQDTGFIKERYEKELQVERAKNTRNVIIMISIVVLLFIGKIVYDLQSKLKSKNKEISAFRENYSNLEKEKDALAKVISDNPPVDSLSIQVLNDRLSLLNKFFAAEITSDSDIDRKAGNELSRLVEDRQNFMYTTRMTFAAANPGFIRFLKEKGLTEPEMEYCCLYAIGLTGKEIGIYIEKKRHYNESSAIRKKLGLGEHDTNLGIYLRKLLDEGQTASF